MRFREARIGIQGVKGSYNHLAIKEYLSSEFALKNIVFLDSTERVFEVVNSGQVRFGQFAVCNNRSGLYAESLEHLACNRFTVIDNYSISVNHALMIHRDQDFRYIRKVKTHPEVIKQCSNKIEKRYSHLPIELTSQEDIDPGHVAKRIGECETLFDTAVIGNPFLAELYGLRIVDKCLSNYEDSRSTFLLIEKFQTSSQS